MSQYDNDYQFECQRRFPGTFANVVRVDVARPDALDLVARCRDRGAAGVRLRPDSRSPGSDPLAIWTLCRDLGMVVSCGGPPEAFESGRFADLLAALPGLPIVLEHLGSLSHPREERPPFEQRRRIFALSAFPDVCLKVHGLGEFCTRKRILDGGFVFHEEALGILDLAISAFGADRIMWGSDYPPVSGREGYRNALTLTSERLAPYGQEAVEKILAGTAARFFGMAPAG
jgi:L-fuconolactonase